MRRRTRSVSCQSRLPNCSLNSLTMALSLSSSASCRCPPPAAGTGSISASWSPSVTLMLSGILDAVDMDSYRAEVRESIRVTLGDQDAEIEPVPAAGGGHLHEAELERLSAIVKEFNEQFGNRDWQDTDRVLRRITDEIPAKVAADTAYKNAMQHSDRQN